MKTKIILKIIFIFVVLTFILQLDYVDAAVQSNGGTPADKDRDSWMVQIRQIETTGGGFGLDETLNTDLTSSSGSNNIDVHMQKNTEYGAMALLSASAYGKPEKIEDGETTTGNETGVVFPYNAEWTAAQSTEYYGKTSYDDRYINYYSANAYEQKNGDAYIETQGWHGTEYLYDISYTAYGHSVGYRIPGGIVRNNNKGIFSFHNRAMGYNQNWEGHQGAFTWMYYNYNDVALFSNTYKSRLVVVNGSNI